MVIIFGWQSRDSGLIPDGFINLKDILSYPTFSQEYLEQLKNKPNQIIFFPAPKVQFLSKLIPKELERDNVD